MKNIIRIPLFSLLICTAASSLCSCTTTVARVDSSQFKATMGIDPQDVDEVCALMVEQMLSGNYLTKKGAKGRSIVVISNFRNNTSLYDFDPNLVYNPVLEVLNNSGLAYSYVKGSDDSFVGGQRSYVRKENEVREFMEQTKISSGPSPQYAITLELIEATGYVGNLTQTRYSITMKLNEISSGLSLFTKTLPINKAKKRARVGL